MRWSPAGASSCRGTSTRPHRRRRWAATPTPGAASFGAAGPRVGAARPDAPVARASARRAIRCSWPASACRRCSPARGPGAARVPRARDPGAVRRHGRALDAAAARAAERVVRARARAARARGRLAASPVAGAGRSPPRSRPRRGRSGWRSRPAHRVDLARPSCRRRAPMLLDLTPRQVARDRGRSPAGRYRRQLEGFRYGPGVFKVDWALDGPIPWADPATARAGTVHLGGPMREIVASEAAVEPGPARGPALRAPRPADASRTRHAPRRASTSPGRTATCPTARPST